MAYLLKFGDYVFPATMCPTLPPSDLDLGEQERPRASGSTFQVGRKKARLLAVAGDVTASTPADLATLDATLRAACVGAGVQKLWLGGDDKYWNAQLQSLAVNQDGGKMFGLMISYSLLFMAADPDAFAPASTTVAGLGAGGTVTTTGTAIAQPAWTLTIGSTGDNVITITNAATGEVATITGTFTAGDVIVLDRAASPMAVTVNTVATFGVFDGRIPQLGPGANVITVAVILGAVTLSVTYTERFV